MEILITGGNGYLGSALATEFARLDFKINLIVRIGSNLSRIDNLNINLFKFKDEEELIRIINTIHPTIVIHTACNYGRNNESSSEIYDANFRFGALIIDSLIKNCNEAVFLNVSTSLPANLNLYSLSKFQFSEFGRKMGNMYKEKFKFINIILQHIYGPNEDNSKFLANVISSLKTNIPILELTKGEQLRDFVYIDDVVEAFKVLLINIEKIKTDQVEIGSGTVISIKNLVLKIKEITKSNTELDFGAIPYRSGEVMYSKSNLTMMNTYGWNPKYDLDKGLKQIININS